MSATDEQPGSAENVWGTRPTERQQAKLEELLHEWEGESDHGDRRGPFDNKALSGADVFWLAICMYRDRGIGEAEAEKDLRKPPGSLRGYNVPPLPLGRAFLIGAHLEGANLGGAHLEGAVLSEAYLKGADLRRAHLEETIFSKAHLEGANFEGAHLKGANFKGAFLEGADFTDAQMEEAILMDAQMEGATLPWAYLGGAILLEAQLGGANLRGAQLGGANLRGAHLEEVVLTASFFDQKSILDQAHLNHATFSRVTFDNTDLTGVHWGEVRELGDELQAKQN